MACPKFYVSNNNRISSECTYKLLGGHINPRQAERSAKWSFFSSTGFIYTPDRKIGVMSSKNIEDYNKIILDFNMI